MTWMVQSFSTFQIGAIIGPFILFRDKELEKLLNFDFQVVFALIFEYGLIWDDIYLLGK